MAYSIDTTSVIQADTVRLMIKDAVERQTGRSVSSIEFNTTIVGADNYKNDGSAVFNGVTIRFLNDVDNSAVSWINRGAGLSSLSAQIASVESDNRLMGDK